MTADEALKKLLKSSEEQRQNNPKGGLWIDIRNCHDTLESELKRLREALGVAKDCIQWVKTVDESCEFKLQDTLEQITRIMEGK